MFLSTMNDSVFETVASVLSKSTTFKRFTGFVVISGEFFSAALLRLAANSETSSTCKYW